MLLGGKCYPIDEIYFQNYNRIFFFGTIDIILKHLMCNLFIAIYIKKKKISIILYNWAIFTHAIKAFTQSLLICRSPKFLFNNFFLYLTTSAFYPLFFILVIHIMQTDHQFKHNWLYFECLNIKCYVWIRWWENFVLSGEEVASQKSQGSMMSFIIGDQIYKSKKRKNKKKKILLCKNIFKMKLFELKLRFWLWFFSVNFVWLIKLD